MRAEVLRAARTAFVLASAGLAGMFIVMMSLPDGAAGVASVAGVPLGDVSTETMRILVGLDLIIPLGYGAGFILLAAGLGTGEEASRLVSAMIILTVVGMSFDLFENGVLLTESSAVSGGVAVTVAKYGTLGAVGFMIPLLLTPSAPHTKLAKPLFQLIVPIVLATTVMRLSGDMGPWLLVPGLIFIFMFAAWLAHVESQRQS